MALICRNMFPCTLMPSFNVKVGKTMHSQMCNFWLLTSLLVHIKCLLVLALSCTSWKEHCIFICVCARLHACIKWHITYAPVPSVRWRTFRFLCVSGFYMCIKFTANCIYNVLFLIYLRRKWMEKLIIAVNCPFYLFENADISRSL